METKKLRVGINARTFSSPNLRGFSRHTLGLLRALARHVDIHLFANERLAPELRPLLSDFPLHEIPIRPYLAWEQAALAALALRHRFNILHSTTNIGIPALSPGVKRVVTIHDLFTIEAIREQPFTQSLRQAKNRAIYEISWRAALTADAILTVSEYSKNELLSLCPQVASRIHVVPNGVEERFSPGPSKASEPYFLYVGGFESRKNVETLVRAHANSGLDQVKLVLAGAPDHRLDAPNVTWAGYVDDDKLIELYRGALATVIPSKREGFGFQVLESMACGTPVIASRATSLPEVGGDAAIYFDPNDADELSRMLRRAAEDKAWLTPYRVKGIARAREFTWERAARATASIYRQLLPTHD